MWFLCFKDITREHTIVYWSKWAETLESIFPKNKSWPLDPPWTKCTKFFPLTLPIMAEDKSKRKLQGVLWFGISLVGFKILIEWFLMVYTRDTIQKFRIFFQYKISFTPIKGLEILRANSNMVPGGKEPHAKQNLWHSCLSDWLEPVNQIIWPVTGDSVKIQISWKWFLFLYSFF
jgi:hypothetical protein